jgi:hypothetical protein
MITAEEKLKANFYNGSFIEIHSGDLEDIENLMIEFAKLHVEAALKAAAKKYRHDEFNYSNNPWYIEDSILNAYPLDKIK